MTLLAATALVALAAGAQISLVIALADRFGHEGQIAGIIGAVPTAA
ncbi:hypothetical protein [Methylobacterium dankookense]|uniref:Uncharacterized protein n=1 Tax=Methylobacterium dankookense TaxID=560405 RepID=A0A564G0E1_9HYPH|nr:hypothetical protein [Methylobacterium dankookense]GJD56154.1 hypothetical protein IFDJLNFL_2049 [Methylobacterium dankookense]VUF13943.1 hypothetical protein MTDSW087_03653 [Methylobacterium dankookense]